MTPTSAPILLTLSDNSKVWEARRIASGLAEELKFSDDQAGRASIVASEVAANLLKHAQEGKLQLRICGEQCLELLAFDSGPGMPNPELCLRDGYSTGGTPGTGLGAIRRLASEFDLYSQPGKGTTLLARLAGDRALPVERLGVVQMPARGEAVCGDAWTIVREPDAVTVMVADGLGHGPLAADASQAAVRIVDQAQPGQSPGELLERVHSALRSTRGAAVAITRVSFRAGRVAFAGLGNIGALVHGRNGALRLVSHNGTAGAQARRIHQFDYDWPPGGTLLMYSDGLASQWDLSAYPGIAAHDPAVIAAVLYRDFNRGRDDATVVALKEPLPPDVR